MSSSFFHPYNEQFQAIGQWLSQEYQTVRTGRASPVLVESIMVEVYGTRGPLKQYASISSQDAKTLVVQPWDTQTLKDIERALSQSDRGFSTIAEQGRLRVVLPDMTEDHRKELVKVLHAKLEQAKTQLRQLRDTIREKIQDQERAKEITQDDKYSLQKELDTMTSDIQSTLLKKTEQKEEELMTV